MLAHSCSLTLLVILLCCFGQGAAEADMSATVLFLLDDTGSLSAADFALELEAVARTLEVLPNRTAVAIERFADTTEPVSALNVFAWPTSRAMAAKQVRNLHQEGGASHIHVALSKARKLLERFSMTERFVVLITDGGPSQPDLTWHEAKKLKDEGVHLLVAGLGPNISLSWIEQIATSGMGLLLRDPDQLGDFVQRTISGHHGNWAANIENPISSVPQRMFTFCTNSSSHILLHINVAMSEWLAMSLLITFIGTMMFRVVVPLVCRRGCRKDQRKGGGRHPGHDDNDDDHDDDDTPKPSSKTDGNFTKDARPEVSPVEQTQAETAQTKEVSVVQP